MEQRCHCGIICNKFRLFISDNQLYLPFLFSIDDHATKSPHRNIHAIIFIADDPASKIYRSISAPYTVPNTEHSKAWTPICQIVCGLLKSSRGIRRRIITVKIPLLIVGPLSRRFKKRPIHCIHRPGEDERLQLNKSRKRPVDWFLPKALEWLAWQGKHCRAYYGIPRSPAQLQFLYVRCCFADTHQIVAVKASCSLSFARLSDSSHLIFAPAISFEKHVFWVFGGVKTNTQTSQPK